MANEHGVKVVDIVWKKGRHSDLWTKFGAVAKIHKNGRFTIDGATGLQFKPYTYSSSQIVHVEKCGDSFYRDRYAIESLELLAQIEDDHKRATIRTRARAAMATLKQIREDFMTEEEVTAAEQLIELIARRPK